jgi:hypothetical protein
MRPCLAAALLADFFDLPRSPREGLSLFRAPDMLSEQFRLHGRLADHRFDPPAPLIDRIFLPDRERLFARPQEGLAPL